MFKLTVLCSCDSADMYSLGFSEMISGFNLSRKTGCGDMFSCHFSFPLEKFRDSNFINPSQIPSRFLYNLSFSSYHRVASVYFILFCVVVKKFTWQLCMFSLLFLLILFCESVVAFLSLVFLLLYTVPCSRATSLSMNCELIKLSRKLRKRDRFIKTVPASIF